MRLGCQGRRRPDPCRQAADQLGDTFGTQGLADKRDVIERQPAFPGLTMNLALVQRSKPSSIYVPATRGCRDQSVEDAIDARAGLQVVGRRHAAIPEHSSELKSRSTAAFVVPGHLCVEEPFMFLDTSGSELAQD